MDWKKQLMSSFTLMLYQIELYPCQWEMKNFISWSKSKYDTVKSFVLDIISIRRLFSHKRPYLIGCHFIRAELFFVVQTCYTIIVIMLQDSKWNYSTYSKWNCSTYSYFEKVMCEIFYWDGFINLNGISICPQIINNTNQ